ncbi:cupin domain-containing protein [Halomarina litorea]|uniref:cupin domain-containing protein n=1 Tax=Halomarina litorea TaxID=2961595 RepID=UPI0020C31E06|nr:cupin domain-containing protein [Halomarina sp. BCD28]
MEHVRVDDVDSWMGPASVKRPLGRALGTEDVALSYYELDAGESFAFGYHRHEGQEEVFYVVSGAVTFRTEDGDVVVESGEAVRFAPGEYQQGVNRGDERVVAIALGAPAESGETDIRRECPDCGTETSQRIERAEDGDALVTLCVECGAETGRFD